MASPANARLAIGYVPICATRIPPARRDAATRAGDAAERHRSLAHMLYSDMRSAVNPWGANIASGGYEKLYFRIVN